MKQEAPRLPGSLQLNRRLSQWLRFAPGGIVEVRSGKVELGQGIATALAQIVAHELDVSPARVRMMPVVTGVSPDEAVTSGSLSVQESGTALRFACAEARALYLEAAAARLETRADSLTISDGEIGAPGGGRTSYWEIENLLDREATAAFAPRPYTPSSARRIDLADKVFGVPRYVHDMELPGMLHGRVVRPPSPAARILRTENPVENAVLVRDGSFVGVLAEREEIAVKAAKKLKVTWDEKESLPDANAMAEWLKAQPVQPAVIADAAAEHKAERTLKARFTKPYLAHASIGPSCALAQWEGRMLRVWTHSQGVYNLRADLAHAFGMAPEDIVVQHAEGAGCYGHNGADDVAFDAALLARAAGGRPVRVVWSREDELGWAPFGPAMLVEVEAGLDAAGDIVSWRQELWSNGHSSRPGRAPVPVLLAAKHLEKPFDPPVAINPAPPAGGADRNSVPGYAFPSIKVISNRVLNMPIRTSALRSLGAFANVFAIESVIDEAAAMKGEDPVAFRLRHLQDPRARAVIEAAARRAGWTSWKKTEGRGHGIGYAKYKNLGAYCAVVAEIEAAQEIRVARLVVAADVGQLINPDGAANQLEGGAIQAASWATREAVRFDRTRVTSASWDEYPILRFSEVPAVEVELIDRPSEKPVGAGEATQGPTCAAIANAVFDALGVRVRDLPLTADHILAALP